MIRAAICDDEQAIRAIVKKYDGTVQFSQENGLFHCDAVLTK